MIIRSAKRMRPGNIALIAALLVANIVAWVWAWLLFQGQPSLLGIALMAWTLGLRHAMDADHIVAIDNVTRHLMQSGRRSVTVGLFFSLGHSSVVMVVTLLLALATGHTQHWFEHVKDAGSTVGTMVSAGLLFVVGMANAVTLWRMTAQLRGMQKVDDSNAESFPSLKMKPWGLAVVLRPFMALIARSWHMLPLGFLFGLGFDTATEISLLGLSAAQAAKGASVLMVMVFPALFAAGMVLVDTLDNMLMLGAYESAFENPESKLRYNILITSISVALALGVGGIELVNYCAEHFQLSGVVAFALNSVGEQFDVVGAAIVGMFILCWGTSCLLARRGAVRGYSYEKEGNI